ncbi:MAG: hypothetical protein JWO15_3645 [Sphingomonadales bacterium]|nr:hypothetical protein [Sphingomonadales bacterium]
MERITWGAVGQRFFEAGVDRGVLYIGTSLGVPWNGLVSVTENPDGGDPTPFYIDGVKYLNEPSSEEFQATLEAFTYPDEFLECDGTMSVVNGLSATQQKRKSFGLSYRTQVGNDVDGTDHGYKIHLVYNALAAPSSVAHAAIGDSVSPDNFSWQITTKPLPVPGFKRTSHFVIDSRETPKTVLTRIEEILYGSTAEGARLPTIPELVYVFNAYTASLFDAGLLGEPYYATFDEGLIATVPSNTIDGGVP